MACSFIGLPLLNVGMPYLGRLVEKEKKKVIWIWRNCFVAHLESHPYLNWCGMGLLVHWTLLVLNMKRDLCDFTSMLFQKTPLFALLSYCYSTWWSKVETPLTGSWGYCCCNLHLSTCPIAVELELHWTLLTFGPRRRFAVPCQFPLDLTIRRMT